jgi:hypothetical protein
MSTKTRLKETRSRAERAMSGSERQWTSTIASEVSGELVAARIQGADLSRRRAHDRQGGRRGNQTR